MLLTFLDENQQLVAEIEPSISNYPDGSLNIRINLTNECLGAEHVYIRNQSLTSQELLSLPSIVDYVRSNLDDLKDIKLEVLYLPNARQDRATGSSPFTLEHTTALILNSCAFDEIRCLDVHSKVSVDLINNLVSISQSSIVKKQLVEQGLYAEDTYCILPDKGALKYKEDYGFEHWISLQKQRDPETGHVVFSNAIQVSGSEEHLVNKNAIMFDDIGASCITHKLAAARVKALGIKHITLVLSHAFLTKGADFLSPEIDRVIVLNKMSNFIEIQTVDHIDTRVTNHEII